MEVGKNTESHLTSAAAFVDGGIQDPCEDTCSICLEEFSESDPSSVTICKHEFHLQCILEWCQRSSQCPMCWQPISLKDPVSQELLEAVERERNVRVTPSRNATIFHHPTLGDFELQHLPVGANDADLEERIIQHLAAAAAMGRAHHVHRRDSQRGRSSAHGRPHFLVFSAHPSAASSGHVSAPNEDPEPVAVTVAAPSSPLPSGREEPSRQIPHLPFIQTNQNSSSASGSNLIPTNQGPSFMNRNSANHTPDRAGPSDLQSFSESLKSKFSAMSMRYKESFSKSTRGWKERLFSRNSSVSDDRSEVRREVPAGIASVYHMMERREAREGDRPNQASVADNLSSDYNADRRDRNNAETRGENSLNDSNTHATCAASSASC